MLPRRLIDVDEVAGQLVPRYLGPKDHPWLSALLEVYDACVGEPRERLARRLEEPIPGAAPRRALLMACQLLDRVYQARVKAAIAPRTARVACARASSVEPSRTAALAAAARELGCVPAELEASLLADIPALRVVGEPNVPLSAAQLALDVNLALVSSLLARARGLRLRLHGRSRDIVRQAQLTGLIVDVVSLAGDAVAELEITGPLSLFRHTTVYGRALASLVPRLGWCETFELRASCVLRPPWQTELVVSHRDPLPWAREPRRFDSKLEARFARSVKRLAPDWDLVREPVPLRVGGRFAFPDFELLHRRDRARRYLIEIAGYYTSAYLHDKLRLLDATTRAPLLLCIDVDRHCDAPYGADRRSNHRPRNDTRHEGLPQVFDHPNILCFRRRLDPRLVLERLGVLPKGVSAPRPRVAP